jgi:hypothetical protein
MTDDVSKLPEWPEKPYRGAGFGELYQYWKEQSDAALARMEALVQFIQDNRHGIRLPLTHDERRQMDELLAACERRTNA